MIRFEDEAPLTGDLEVLNMLIMEMAYGAETDIREDPTQGPYLTVGKIKANSWPEQLESMKCYPISKEAFESLKLNGYIQKVTPISWSTTPAGNKYFADATAEGEA